MYKIEKLILGTPVSLRTQFFSNDDLFKLILFWFPWLFLISDVSIFQSVVFVQSPPTLVPYTSLLTESLDSHPVPNQYDSVVGCSFFLGVWQLHNKQTECNLLGFFRSSIHF